MWKPATVVMLSTNEKANTIWKTTNGQLIHIHVSGEYKERYEPQHLYILSDEEIKEGDWYYQHNSYGSVIDKCDNKSPFVAKSARYIWENGGKKIIATTDKSLGLVVDNNDIPMPAYSKLLPQPSQSFIEKYVEEYNKGNIITEVMVEYEEGFNSRSHEAMGCGNGILTLKINPKDNSINIKPIKNNYNREEIEYLLHLVVN